jgi:integrase
VESQLELYRSYLSRRKSGKTARMYEWVVSKFVDYMRARGVQLKDATLADVEGFLDSFKAKDRSLALYSYALANFLEFVGRGDLARAIPVTRYEVREPRWLEREKVMELINACEDPIFKAMFWTSYELALRVGEAVNLKWEDVDLENRIVYVARLKKKKQQRLPKPISRELAELLGSLPRYCEYVFPAYGRRGGRGWHRMSERKAEMVFKEVASRVGLKDCSFHVLRHSRATEIAMKTGGDVVAVAKITDHDNPSNVLIYCHIALRRLRELAGAG